MNYIFNEKNFIKEIETNGKDMEKKLKDVMGTYEKVLYLKLKYLFKLKNNKRQKLYI